MTLILLGSSLAFGISPEPASAAYSTTSTPPYAHSWTYSSCSWPAYCDIDATADHTKGTLGLDMTVVGAKNYWFYCWPSCSGGTGDSGGWGSANVETVHNLPKSVSAITFTVIAETGPASAEASGVAKAEASLQAYGVLSNCYEAYCQGGASVVLASSSSQPSSAATTRTLKFTFKNPTGKIPAGQLRITVSLSGYGQNIGTSTVRASAAVTSVSTAQT